MTNGDWIRSMKDVELSQWVTKLLAQKTSDQRIVSAPNRIDDQAWLDNLKWMEQEHKEGVL